MGRDNATSESLLREVLEISRAQGRLFKENRLEDLLLGQSVRERLLAGLDKDVDYKKEPYCSIIREILDNDRVLSLSIESLRDEVGGKLKKIRGGVMAMKAYGSYSIGS